MRQLEFIQRLFDYNDMKVQIAAFYAGLFSLICSFSEAFMGISGSLFVLLYLVMVTDYITGLKAAKREGQKFISRRGLQWVFKIGSYMVFLAVSFMVRREIMLNEVTLLIVPFKLIHFYILIHIFLWEIKSIDENFERLGYSFRVLKLADNIFSMAKRIVKRKIEESGDETSI